MQDNNIKSFFKDIIEKGRSFFLKEGYPRLTKLVQFLFGFLKNPFEQVYNIPDWRIEKLIGVIAFLAAISGFLYGLLSGSIVNMFLGLVVMPISSIMVISLMAVAIYYFFLFFQKQELSFKKLFYLIAISCIPIFLGHPLSALIPIFDLVIFAFSAVLLTKGLVKNFQVNQKLVIKLIVVIYIIFVLIKLFNFIQMEKMDREWKKNFSINGNTNFKNVNSNVHLNQLQIDPLYWI